MAPKSRSLTQVDVRAVLLRVRRKSHCRATKRIIGALYESLSRQVKVARKPGGGFAPLPNLPQNRLSRRSCCSERNANRAPLISRALVSRTDSSMEQRNSEGPAL